MSNKKNSELKYQYNFSCREEEMHNRKTREIRGKRILLVLKDYYKKDLRKLTVLDIGGSTGIIDNYLAPHFKKIICGDVDEEAINYGKKKKHEKNLFFMIADAMQLPFADRSIDIVICTQVYEHVPDSKRLFPEIYRVLKKSGICYFAAGNRIRLIEEHYDLPFLSLLPKSLANIYIRIFTKETEYYENLLTYWQLLKLVKNFTVIDYTKKIFDNPEKFGYKIRFKDVVRYASKFMMWLSPNYIWILKK